MTRILRGLGSRRLECGCLAGIYETYDGRTVSIIDVHGEHCPESSHLPGQQEDEAESARGRQVNG